MYIGDIREINNKYFGNSEKYYKTKTYDEENEKVKIFNIPLNYKRYSLLEAFYNISDDKLSTSYRKALLEDKYIFKEIAGNSLDLIISVFLIGSLEGKVLDIQYQILNFEKSYQNRHLCSIKDIAIDSTIQLNGKNNFIKFTKIQDMCLSCLEIHDIAKLNEEGICIYCMENLNY